MIELFVSAIAMPVAATILMTLMKRLPDRKTQWGEFVEDLGWELCVLGLGLVGGVATNPRVQSALAAGAETTGSEASSVAGSVVAFAVMWAIGDVILGSCVLFLRKSAIDRRLIRFGALTLGVLAVGVPTALVLW